MNDNFKSEEHEAIAEFVRAFKDLTTLLGAAAEVRYTASPGSPAAKGAGQDPTADTVLDTDRTFLESTMLVARVRLQQATALLRDAEVGLRSGIAPYEGS